MLRSVKIKLFLCLPLFLFAQGITEADSLVLAKKEKEALQIYLKLLKTDSLNGKLLGKIADLYCEIGFSKSDEVQQERDYMQAIFYAEKAVSHLKNDKNYFSLSRAYGRLALVSSTKEQLKLSVKVKDNAEKAVALNPNNDKAWHVIGKWNFRIADLTWIERAVANTVLGGVPEGASFENAKKAFLKASEIKANAIAHQLELAKTLIKLDQEKEALQLLKQAQKLPLLRSVDQRYFEEAKDLIDDLE